MATTPLRVGIFGSGGIAERAMMEPAASIDGVQVVAMGSRDPERARAFADRFGIRSAGSYADVMADPEVDLIYVALPPTVHAEWATAALCAGAHVLCEKPLSANGADARRIAEAADENGRAAFVGFHYRLHSFTRRLLDVLASGVLGDIHDVEVDFSIPHFVVKPGNIRLDGDLGGGAVILDEKADVTESSYAAQLRHLVDVLPDGPSPLRAADAVRTMALVDDVYRAAGLQPR